MSLKKLAFPLGLLLLLMPCGCTEDESDLGIALQDPFTLYQGVRDTISLTACTILDDSLSTAGYQLALMGDYSDANFGSMEAVIYSQIAAPTEGVNITDAVIFDSVVMTLVVDTVYPIMPDSTPRPLHIVVNQLAEELKADSAYLSSQRLAESDVCFFDGMVTYYADSVRLRMNESIYPVLRQSCSHDDFFGISKGMSIRLYDHSQTAVTVDFAASNTRLTLYYHTESIDSTLQFTFTINSTAGHSMYFAHDYAGTPLSAFAADRGATIDGSQRLYLEPLGGTRVRVNFDEFVGRFRAEHPAAVVHHAELVVPVCTAESDTSAPVRLLALKRGDDGAMVYVTDANVLANPYTYAGFDGYYSRDKQQYRLRITRHLQEILRSGAGSSTELVIDARRSSAFRAVVNGTATDNPIRIDFIYSE